MQGCATKAEQVKNWIAKEIRNGNFARGTTLPSEYELAERVGVSYMTLRKAVGALVDEGLLERAKGSGTFVRSEIPERKLSKIVGLAIPAWSAPENLDILMHYGQACEEAGLLFKYVHARNWEDRAILDLWMNSDALVLTGIQAMEKMPAFLLEKLRNSTKPVVVNKGSADYLGKDSVHYTRDERMEEPCASLCALGHRRIMLVDQAIRRRDGELVSIHPNINGFEEIFRERHPDVAYDTKTMIFDVPLYHLPQPLIRRAFAERRAKVRRHTAVICPMSLYWAVMSGLGDIGLKVPDDMSVLTFGDRQEREFYCPRPAAFSVLMRYQAYRTLELIRWRFAHPNAKAVAVQAETSFDPGETLAPAKRPRLQGKEKP